MRIAIPVQRLQWPTEETGIEYEQHQRGLLYLYRDAKCLESGIDQARQLIETSAQINVPPPKWKSSRALALRHRLYASAGQVVCPAWQRTAEDQAQPAP